MAENEKNDKFMLMVHKDFPDRTPARVLKYKFEKVWKEKGWEEFKEEKPAAASSTSSNKPASGGSDNK